MSTAGTEIVVAMENGIQSSGFVSSHNSAIPSCNSILY